MRSSQSRRGLLHACGGFAIAQDRIALSTSICLQCEASPSLKQFGVSDKRLIYKFDFNGARFIFLWTGKYDYRSPSSWDADRPKFEAQMKELTTWLDEAKAAGTGKVFISFHAPAFARSGMGPIPELQTPTG